MLCDSESEQEEEGGKTWRPIDFDELLVLLLADESDSECAKAFWMWSSPILITRQNKSMANWLVFHGSPMYICSVLGVG